MKRKSVVAVLMAAMMLSATACGNDAAETKADPVTETSAETETETETEDNAEAEAESEAEAEPEADTSGEADTETETEPEESADDQEEEASGAYEKGTVDGNNFESAWLGVRYEAPEGFIMASEEELEQLLLTGGELIYEDDAQKFIDYAKLTTVYEMMTYLPQANNAGDPNLNLVVEKNNASAEEYGEALKAQMDVMYAQAEVEWKDVTNAAVGGIDCLEYDVSINIEGQALNQSYYIADKDGRVICFILSYTDAQKENADALMNAFKPL